MYAIMYPNKNFLQKREDDNTCSLDLVTICFDVMKMGK